jgi:hypothetical protein
VQQSSPSFSYFALPTPQRGASASGPGLRRQLLAICNSIGALLPSHSQPAIGWDIGI